MVVHFVSVLFSGFVIYMSQPGSSFFSWHPTLMTLAFSFLVVQAFLIYSPQSSLLANKPRKIKTFWHWFLMLLAWICALIGFTIIYLNKEDMHKAHFISWHGIIGVTTIIYMTIQLFGGLNLLYPKWIAEKFINLASLKIAHATSGLFLFMLITASLVTAIYSNYFVSLVSGTSWYACLVCPLILLQVFATQVKNTYLAK